MSENALGGGKHEWGYGIAIDSAGNTYVTGETGSYDFPTYNAIQATSGGGWDTFVTQIIRASGVYTYGYSTYLGGSDGDWGFGIAVSANGMGHAYVTGGTASSDFPTCNAIATTLGGDIDAFVTKITTDATSPAVVAVAPGSGAADVALTAPVVVTFSEPINTSTFAYNVTPDPGGWSAAWSGGDTAVTLAHDPFASQTTYTVTVTAATDLGGNPLAGAPYAWHFTTVSYRLYLPLVVRSYQ